MECRRVIVVGDSVFADSLAAMLERSGAVAVVARVATPNDSLALVRAHNPDAAVVADSGEFPEPIFGELVAAFPDLPVLRASLAEDTVQVVTSRRVEAHLADLLEAIRALPRRGSP